MTQATTWKTRWTFILAAAGSSVGLGNIWKFPYIAGENGGAAFIAVYVLCILGIGIPVMIAETLIGKAGRANPIVASRKLAQIDGKPPIWALLGGLGILTGLLINMFYVVIGGWALDYVVQSISNSYANIDAGGAKAQFTAMLSDPTRQLASMSVFLLLNLLVIGFGVQRGIGLASRILMPLLTFMLIVLVIYGAIEGDFIGALNFMFDVNFSALSGNSIIVAMGHAFFTLSVGMGAIMAYGAYMPEKEDIGRNIITIALIDTGIALLAGLAMYPLILGNQLEPNSGPGLMFETLPLAFGGMPGGIIVGTTFFTLISIAALTSAMSLFEPAVAWLEQLNVSRWISTGVISLLIWLGGVTCIYRQAVFDTLATVTENFMLPTAGLLTCIFVGWTLRRVTVRKQLNLLSMPAFNCWYIAIRFIAPLSIIIIFINAVL